MSSTTPRRFKVEPFETTVRSSKDSSTGLSDSSKPRRRFAPTPIETTTRSCRRFAPEPVETTIRSSPEKDAEVPTQQSDSRPAKPARRRSQEKFQQEWSDWESKPKRTFKPQPVETASRSNRKQENDVPSTSTSKSKRPARRFAPLLIETATRTRRVGDTSPALLPSDETTATAEGQTRGARRTRPRPVPPPPENTPIIDMPHNPLFLEIQRATSPLAMRRRNSRCSMRSHHSFRVPDLEPIESSESEGSSPPSPTTSPSVISDHSYMYKEATRMRESVDERSSGYLLELAARAAEKQLEEQAMAAFPNDDRHEPVDHYVDHDSDDLESQAEDLKRRRESSFSEINWEFSAMQEHRAKVEKEEAVESEKKIKTDVEAIKSPGPKHSPWGNAAALLDSSRPKDLVGGWQRDEALDRMRKDARPPMLGRDIRFPRCQSPEPARFDTTQGTDAIRIAMCYLSEQSQQAEKGEGLWCGGSSSKQSSARPSLYYSNPPSRLPSRGASRGGLWGGCCVSSGLTPPRGPTGLLTPSHEICNPFSPCPTPAMSLLPPTPPASTTADFACIDEKLAAEAAIDDEFGDDFVTQVYNYLSLGYPSLARTFDDELSKVSNIPTSDLRHDDHLPSSRGYIRLGEDGNLKDTSITEETCVRWQALRVYIREWAKQQPNMAADTTVGVGVAVRKGSWAI